jgi:hypothetical protein
MCKLIEGPRVPTELKTPTVKRRKKKSEPSDEKVEVKYTALREGGSSQVTQLFELYKQDPYKARVKFMNSPSGYSYTRLVIFEFGEKDFEITEFDNKFGISVTNRIYSSQKKLNSIVYKKGKFYRINNNAKRRGVTPMTFYGLLDFIRCSESVGYARETSDLLAKSKVYEFLTAKFPWIKTLSETEAAYGLAFNTVVSKGLTGQKDLLRHVYKVPMNVINIIQKEVGSIASVNNRHYIRVSNRPRNIYDKLKQWKEISKVLDGVQNLNEDIYHHPHFYDTCDMAKKLGRKVNCRWGVNKLNQVHDDWAKDLRNILLDCEIEYVMKVRKPFYVLARDTGWKLLFTNKEMLVEGVRQNHCVGGYIDRVQRGECAIFHVEGYTLQVSIERVAVVPNKFRTSASLPAGEMPSEAVEKMLLQDAMTHVKEGDEKPRMFYSFKNLQFRGHKNVDPPAELVQRVNTVLSAYANESTQDMFEGKIDADEFKAICDEVHKTKWTVVINHVTSKYEISENTGLGEIKTDEVLDIDDDAFDQNDYNALINDIEALPF